MTHRALAAFALAACILSASGTLAGQQAPSTASTPAPPQTALPDNLRAFQDSPDARVTFQRFQELLRQHPPAVGEVLARDPSLLTRADYLAPYPALLAFLQQHPEIARNPSFFLGGFEFRQRDKTDRAIDLFQGVLGGLAGLTVFSIVVSVLVWLVRAVIDHRRWLRLSRVQVDVHSKLLDRLQSNEDLLAYMQTPSGRRFLESAPITLDGEPRPGGAPLTRIVLSLQAGVVLIALGIGLRFVEWNMIQEVAEGFRVIGIIVISLGIGFTASALVAYAVSSRLGLIAARKTEASTT